MLNVFIFLGVLFIGAHIVLYRRRRLSPLSASDDGGPRMLQLEDNKL